MSTNLTVEGIVAQIRKRIAEESVQGSNPQPQNGSPVSISIQPDYHRRIVEDAQRFVELERQIEAAATNIGGAPPVPPTLRGRFGSWMIDGLRRLFWWYAAPIKQTVDLLNRRNREQASRHRQMQEQILVLMNRLQQVIDESAAVEVLRRELKDWQNENQESHRELVQQVNKVERNNADARMQLATLTEKPAKDTGRMSEKLELQLEEIRQCRFVVEQNFTKQINELKGNVQELRVSSAVAGALRPELERRVAETVRTLWSELIETRLNLETDAHEALAVETNGRVERLQQNLTAQIDEIQVSLQKLRISNETAETLRAELTQRVSETASVVWGRLPVLETQLRAETEAREALAQTTNGNVERLGQNLKAQVDEIKGSLQELRISNANAETLRAELAQRVSETANMAWGRLPVLETQLRAEAEAREALAQTTNGNVERLGQNLKAQIDEIKGSLQELRISNATADALRAELAQRVSETANMAWGRLPVLETQLREEAEAREALSQTTNGNVERLDQNLKAQIDEIKGSLQELRISNATAEALRAELTQRVSETANMAWGRLPALETQLREEAEAREVLTQTTNSNVERLDQKLNGQADEIKGSLQQLRISITQRVSEIARMETEARHALAVETNKRIGLLDQEIRDGMGGAAERASNLALAIDKQRSELSVQEHRLAMFLRELRKQLPKTLTEVQVRKMTDQDDQITALYAEFEDVFRGPVEEITERLKVYLPHLQRAKVGLPEAPVLDLGCGRGEWLSLLAKHNLTARGVDANRTMINRCTAMNLDVIKGDALAHLQSLPDKSLGAITSFHMVEHLPFDVVITLVDEALRVLRSGGLLILETPNPQNALVGSQTFWIDPTHLRPIPSQTLRFFVEARGFCQVEVLNLQPYAEAMRLPENNGSGGVAQRFNEYFYGPQDYSIIGRRP